MRTISDLEREFRPLLLRAGVVFPDDELRLLIEAAAGVTRTEPHANTTVTPEAATALATLVQRRIEGEPLPYITRVAPFRSIALAVGPGVFIPRTGTSTVVDRAEATLPRNGIVADLCTGCGAIALAIASERPDATVYGSDISADALSWAEQNRSTTSLDVTLLLGDLFDPFPDRLRGRIDVVVSNPPHVPTREAHVLPRDVVEHEPAVALFAESDGLGVITRLATEAPEWLKPTGWFVCEIGDSQEGPVLGHLNALGYEKVRGHCDELGRRRVAEGRLGG